MILQYDNNGYNRTKQLSGKTTETRGRRSKDGIIIENKRLLEEVEERGWDIWNGNIEEDEKKELTYVCRGERLIGNSLCNWKYWRKR